MSMWTHCDNESCDQTKRDGGVEIRRYGQPAWVTVEQSGVTLHFHDAKCLAAHLSPLESKAATS